MACIRKVWLDVSHWLEARHYISNPFKFPNTELPPCFVMDNFTKKKKTDISTVTKKSRCW